MLRIRIVRPFADFAFAPFQGMLWTLPWAVRHPRYDAPIFAPLGDLPF